jgi:hypothetical protein
VRAFQFLQSITALKTRSASSALREVLADVEDKIKSGIALSEAFESQGIFHGFTQLPYFLVKKAERWTRSFSVTSTISNVVSGFPGSCEAHLPIRLFSSLLPGLWSHF